MFWAIASSVLVIYLYRQLNAEGAPAAEKASGSLGAELDALDARITALESKVPTASAGVTRP